MSRKHALKYASQTLHKVYSTSVNFTTTNICIHSVIELSPYSSTSPFLHERHGYCYTQKLFLVNVKLKWVKDRGLDHVVEKEKDLKPVIALKDIVKKETGACLPISAVSKRNKELGLRIRVSRFLRQYPTIFEEYVGEKYNLPWFRLTKEALELEEEEQRIHEQQEADTAARLCKLLMITTQKKLPLQMIDQLKWDLGLPDNYLQSLVPNYPDYFSIINMPDNQPGLDLVCWNDEFAISALQKGAAISGEYQKGMPLAFPMNYSSGHGIKKKVIEWIKEWQNLPYISPYEDASHLNPNSDLSEKRVVGVLHELLNIMVHKKAERCNLVNLREQLGLPHKFAKCFARHPGIFYLSMKNGTITVILREAYKRAQLIQKDPLMSLREKYIHLMKKGVENRRKGLYKKRSSERQDSEDVESDKGLQKCDDDGEHSYADEESQEENVSTEDEDSDDKDLSEDEDDMDEDEDGVDEDGDEDEDDALTDAESSQEEYEEFFERRVRTCGRGHSSFKTSERQGSNLKPPRRGVSDLKTSGRRDNTFETSGGRASKFKARGRRGSNDETSGRRDSHFETSRGQASGLKPSGRHTSNFKTSGSQASNLESSGRRGSNFGTPARRASNLERSGRRGSNFGTPARRASNFEISGRRASNFRASKRV